MPYILENMTAEDITQVAAIERLCFSMPWPTSAYKRELKTPDTNRYIVVRFIPPEDAPALGLQLPNEQNLTALDHPMLHTSNGHEMDGGRSGRSWLDTLLPWRRPAANRLPEIDRNHARFPVVGYAGLWLMVDEAHVTTIGVHPDHRGQGAGELLFLGLADLAAELNALRVTLEVRVSNTGAQALYRKFGLDIAGLRRRYYSDNGEDAYIMWSEPVTSPQFQHRLSKVRAQLAERLRSSFTQRRPPSHPVDTSKLQ
ncbi:MAG TPA: ribosomal protein S18-alanine N-acetyltransferase [Chloroflexia bacterium]|nr:ribosomal protein S18-alanine N-acetyltransferase [Chloroflexia bacterium]